MKTNIFKRSISFLLALILCVSFFVEPGTTVFAAVGEKADVYIVEFPRSGEANLSGWGHKDLKYMNGWNTGGASDTMALRAIGSYTGKICYCIEPGTGQYTGDTFTQKDENFWNNFPSEFNRTIGGDEIKIFIGRILQYGYTGNLSTEWKTQDASGADKLSFAIATQILIWETIVGERNENFNHVDTGNCDRVLDFIKENNPIRSQILKHYSDIEKSVQNHTKVPSFCARSAGKAKTVEMQWDGKQYISVLTDSNGVLGDYNFSSNNESIKFSVSGNKLTITANTAPSDAVSITASRKNSQRKGLITWTDGIYTPGKGSQDMVTYLNTDGVPTPSGKGSWLRGTIQSILTNEKYKGDAVLNKTYISDCLTKKVKINNGERPKYYVENNHPAIIDSATFGRVQEEIARRSGKRKVKQVGTKTEQGKYSGKYALTELLICGECGTPYRRCTWTAKGKKKIVWRCINRLDYGKKYCHHSPSVEESVLQNAIMSAVIDTAKQNCDILKTLKLHIGMGLEQNNTEDKTLDVQIRIAEIDAEFKSMLKAISSDSVENFDETKATELMNEKSRLEQRLAQYADAQQKRENAKSRLDEIYTILDGLKNHPLTYDDQIIRQILECVVVESKEKIKVVFVGGLEVEQMLN